MDTTTVVVFGVFAVLVVGYGVYKHYKNKARRLAKKLEDDAAPTVPPSGPVSGGGGSIKDDHVAQQAK